MTSSLVRRTAAATAGLAAVLSTVAIAAPASAEVFTKTDPAGDVITETGEAPGVKQGDIRKVRFEHARRVVTMKVGYRALDKTGIIQQYVRLDTPTESYQLLVFAGEGSWQGQVLGECDRAESRFDYRDDVFTLTIPRGCLDNPRWVRAGLATITGDEAEETFSGLDDALQDGFDLGDEDVVLSPRLSRAGGAYTG